jgi:uncharacterized membrane protein YgdD (TMEM256/DUF423 family)
MNPNRNIINTLLVITSIAGFLGVALGAFGAHGLKPYLSQYQQTIYEKAVFYQMTHTIIAFCSILLSLYTSSFKILISTVLFLIGILFFSGSLYLLATPSLHSLPTSLLGPITPIGGLFFLAGWISLGIFSFSVGNRK